MAASTEDKSTTAARMKTGKKREANYELLRWSVCITCPMPAR